MFRATLCPSSEEIIVSLRHLVCVTLCGWLSGMQGWMQVGSTYKCWQWIFRIYLSYEELWCLELGIKLCPCLCISFLHLTNAEQIITITERQGKGLLVNWVTCKAILYILNSKHIEFWNLSTYWRSQFYSTPFLLKMEAVGFYKTFYQTVRRYLSQDFLLLCN